MCRTEDQAGCSSMAAVGFRELGINEKSAHGVGRWWMDVRTARLEIPFSRYQLFTNPECNGLNPGRSLI